MVLDALTYAGVRESLDGLDGVRARRGRHRRPRARRAACCASERIDVVVNFAAESHNSLADPRPGSLLPHERARHAGPVRGGPAGRRRAPPPRLDVRGVRRPRPRRRPTPSPRRRRTGPARRTTPSKAGGDHAVRAYFETWGLPVTITNCANNYGPYQFPEKVIPFFTTQALQDLPLPMYASTANRREWIHAARPLPRHRPRARPRPGRRDLPRRHRRGAQHRGHRRRSCSATSASRRR